MPRAGFTYHKPYDVRLCPETLPPGPGVYLVCTSNQSVLDRLQAGRAVSPVTPAGFEPLYVGSAVNLRRRVRCHVKNNSLSSTLRTSLGTLLLAQLGLTALAADVGGALWFEQEGVLTEWIDHNCIIGVCEDARPVASERVLIDQLAPPLNISFRKTTPGARHLLRERANLRRAARELRCGR